MNFFKTTLNVALTILLISLSATSSFSQTTTVSPEYKLEKIGFSRVTYAGSDKRFSYFIYRFGGDEGENPFEFKNTTRINPYNGSINRGYQYTINAPAIDDNTWKYFLVKTDIRTGKLSGTFELARPKLKGSGYLTLEGAFLNENKVNLFWVMRYTFKPENGVFHIQASTADGHTTNNFTKTTPPLVEVPANGHVRRTTIINYDQNEKHLKIEDVNFKRIYDHSLKEIDVNDYKINQADNKIKVIKLNFKSNKTEAVSETNITDLLEGKFKNIDPSKILVREVHKKRIEDRFVFTGTICIKKGVTFDGSSIGNASTLLGVFYISIDKVRGTIGNTKFHPFTTEFASKAPLKSANFKMNSKLYKSNSELLYSISLNQAKDQFYYWIDSNTGELKGSKYMDLKNIANSKLKNKYLTTGSNPNGFQGFQLTAIYSESSWKLVYIAKNEQGIENLESLDMSTKTNNTKSIGNYTGSFQLMDGYSSHLTDGTQLLFLKNGKKYRLVRLSK